jgi:hypothetical protein
MQALPIAVLSVVKALQSEGRDLHGAPLQLRSDLSAAAPPPVEVGFDLVKKHSLIPG